MTKPEKLGFRSLTFSKWCRNKLPNSTTGFSITDLDFILFNWKSKRFMIVETKCRMANVSFNQREIFSSIHKWIKSGIQSDSTEWDYRGFNLVQFENTSFDDGKCFLNKIEISERKLIEFLSMEN
jgi:hypothetical protein